MLSGSLCNRELKLSSNFMPSGTASSNRKVYFKDNDGNALECGSDTYVPGDSYKAFIDSTGSSWVMVNSNNFD